MKTFSTLKPMAGFLDENEDATYVTTHHANGDFTTTVLSTDRRPMAYITGGVLRLLHRAGHIRVVEALADSTEYVLDYNPCSRCRNNLSSVAPESFMIDRTGINMHIGPRHVRRDNNKKVCLECAHHEDLYHIRSGENPGFSFTSGSDGAPLEITNAGMTIMYPVDKTEKCNAGGWSVVFRDHLGRYWTGVTHHHTKSILYAKMGSNPNG
jgi:hypothetical protein